MILSCNSCEKKFVVPDKAITDTGRIVQCGSCGNKWKQYPIKNKTTINEVVATKKITPVKREKKKKIKKTREINLYSPEYLKKKHGINLDNIKNIENKKYIEKVSFGFYNFLVVFIITIIALSKVLHFFQDIIVLNFPFTEFYLSYFFESMRNIFDILKNLISNY
jgi:predicted Zn finger-like uncharacterized protein